MNPNASAVNQLLMFALTIGIMLGGMDIIFRYTPFHGLYRRTLNRSWQFIKRHSIRFLRWSWREYKQFIIGTCIGVIATLYCMGRLT